MYILSLPLSLSVLVSHLSGEVHADIQHNELVLFNCDGGVEEVEIEAQGGVVAGDLKVRNTELHSMLNIYPLTHSLTHSLSILLISTVKFT